MRLPNTFRTQQTPSSIARGRSRLLTRRRARAGLRGWSRTRHPYSQRKDVATWTTPVLDHDLIVTGDVVADLHAATSGTDGDWVVKLIDVYLSDPAVGKMSGYQLMIVDGIFRGRYRESYEHPEAIPANRVEEYKYSLHGADHVFLKGHRIMVQVQSSWFPLYDRNPQTFVPNIILPLPATTSQPRSGSMPIRTSSCRSRNELKWAPPPFLSLA